MILLVTNSRDFAVEPIVEELQHSGSEYLRLDLDLLQRDEISLNPVSATLHYRMAEGDPSEIRSPRAMLYRAPTHLRESSGHRYTPDELLARHQWAALARSLMVFRSSTWINHPSRTYVAENKPLQLSVATAVGLAVPETRVANYLPDPLATRDAIAVKALDTFLVRKGNEDLFFYTQRMQPAEFSDDECQKMPLIFQEYFEDKVDVRITVVGETCFVAETSCAIEGDWRQADRKARFQRADAPTAVLKGSCALMRELGLLYGAIDFVRCGDVYTFLEINPTGEWAWLDELFGGGIAQALTAQLLES